MKQGQYRSTIARNRSTTARNKRTTARNREKGRFHRGFSRKVGQWVLMRVGLMIIVMVIQEVQIAWVQVPLRVGFDDYSAMVVVGANILLSFSSLLIYSNSPQFISTLSINRCPLFIPQLKYYLFFFFFIFTISGRKKERHN